MILLLLYKRSLLHYSENLLFFIQTHYCATFDSELSDTGIGISSEKRLPHTKSHLRDSVPPDATFLEI